MNRRHSLILAVWAGALILAVIVLRDRIFPVPPTQTSMDVPVPLSSEAQTGETPSSPGSQSVRVSQALKDANPAYNGRGQFVETQGRVTAADLSGTGLVDLSALQGLPLETLDIKDNPVSDLSPLEGAPLRTLGAENTNVSDLRPLAGMPLKQLYLNNTPVEDISPLKGLPLEVLNLYGTKVKDLTSLTGMPLQTVWLNGTAVESISPLAGCPLVSLTIERTAVSDLTPLANSRLERLHIADSAVTDLTPLRQVPLQRLIFSPEHIQHGMAVVRNMQTLRELGTSLDQCVSPANFWKRHDAQGNIDRP